MARRGAAEPLREDLRAARDHELRVDRERFLTTVDEAREFLRERGMLTTLPSCALPSLFGACEPPEDPDAKGWDRWPQDKWWWDSALASSAGVLTLKVLRGKRLFVDERLASAFDPVCRASLERAEEGELGEDAAALVRELLVAGPMTLDEARTSLAFETTTMRRARAVVEHLGAVVSREVEVPARNGGHRHTSELRRWDQVHRVAVGGDVGSVIEAAVAAAVAVPEHEVQRWFTWPSGDAIQRLVDSDKLARPSHGWLTTGPRSSL